MEEAKIDRAAMGRLAKALVFVCGPDHPTTVAHASGKWQPQRPQVLAQLISRGEMQSPETGVSCFENIVHPVVNKG